MSISAGEVEQALLELEKLGVEILRVVEPNIANVAQDALETLQNLLAGRALSIRQQVAEVDDAAQAALDAKFPRS